jgi:uncharacterized membrane protein
MSSIRRQLQITFVTGLLVIIPIAVPVWVFWELFTFVERLLAPLVGGTFPFHLPGLYRIPIFRSVYSAVKQLLNAFSPDNQVAFKEFVVLQNREGHYCFGFLTGAVALQRANGTTEPLLAVYVPTNHLYLGDILLARREDIILTRLTVPQGIQIILSGGISIPQVLRQDVSSTEGR